MPWRMRLIFFSLGKWKAECQTLTGRKAIYSKRGGETEEREKYREIYRNTENLVFLYKRENRFVLWLKI